VRGASEHGVWVRFRDPLPDGTPVEAKVVAGYKTLANAVGSNVTVTLVNVNTALGFIDVEYRAGIEPRKRERLERKRAAARRLADRIGEQFEVEVTGVTPKAVWVRTVSTGSEGRLVRGASRLDKGDRVTATLLVADAQRGYIDFARE
jgi:hypothetical protein